MAKKMLWKIKNLEEVPPMKDSFTPGWHSVRWFFDIEGFGVNAITRQKGERLTKTHDEVKTNQQELFIVTEGKVKFLLDGEEVIGQKGDLLVVEQEFKRSADALVSPTTLIIVGAPKKGTYIPPSWG